MSDETARPGAQLVIAATFTAEPLGTALDFILRQAGIALAVQFAPYNQIFQELLSNDSSLAKSAAGVNVLLIRAEDLVRDQPDPIKAQATLQQLSQELPSAIDAYLGRSTVPTIVAILSPSPEALAGHNGSLIARVTQDLRSALQAKSGIMSLSVDEIDAVSTDEQFDRISDDLAHIPYTQEHFGALALALVRKVHAVLVPAQKVLVLDCDNTLWEGVVGEDGREGIAISPGFASLQQFAIDAHAKGTLICLASKNEETDVLDVLENHPEMILRSHHVVAHRINWDAKPQNIRSLAQTLNLGLDSFVFLDDNPVECALVRSQLPEVVTIQVPPPAELGAFVSNLWVFDKVNVTDEDIRRTQMYKENAARQHLEATSVNVADFLQSLNVTIDINEPGEGDWPRLSQLTQRTNQFNFTTIRRTEAELKALKKAGSLVFRVNVSDRFGDYGLVGLVVARPETDRLSVDTILLSCRVLGRGVEHAILRRLGEDAIRLGRTQVEICYRKTRRNEPARAFIESVAAKFKCQREGEDAYLIPTEDIILVAHKPGFDPEAVIEASRSGDGKPAVGASGEGSARSNRYSAIATLRNGRDVLLAMRASNAQQRTLPGKPAPARTQIEKRLLDLWEDALGIDGLGIDDDYSALGGTSLVAATLFAEIERRFGSRLPLTTILDAPTVRSLASRLASGLIRETPRLVELKGGSKDNLFLVHDGDGETLLYKNLAEQMPDHVAVYGIEPQSAKGIPLAHSRIEDMASAYVQTIRQRQPSGPYYVGGMCAGGVIAYEMATRLAEAGEKVELVAILDAATPDAERRPYRIAKQRLNNLSALLTEQSGNHDYISRAVRLTGALWRKFRNSAKWEITQAFEKLSVAVRFKLLHILLRRHSRWPEMIRPLTVRQIYESAEAKYRPRGLTDVRTVLFRATKGEGGDLPYTEIYADETFGWQKHVTDLTTADVLGGHFTMLQKPFVDSLAGHVRKFLDKPAIVRASKAKIEEPAL